MVALMCVCFATHAMAQDAGVDAGPIIVDGPDLLGLARPQVSAAASPSQLRLGETVNLFIEVVYDEKVGVSLPATLDLAPYFEEIKRTSSDERRTDGTRKRTYQVAMRAWELGDLRIPPIQVGYTAGGQQSWVVTNTVPVQVLGSYADVDDKTQLNPDTSPVNLRRRDYRVPLLGLGLVTIAILAFVGWRLSRRKKPTYTPVAFEPASVVVKTRLTGPAERALAAIEALEKKGTLVSEPRDGYDELVGILRTFASEQYGVPILDRTSDELLRSLKDRMAQPVWVKTRRWFARCDLVKYAAERPAADGSKRDVAGAREVIMGVASG